MNIPCIFKFNFLFCLSICLLFCVTATGCTSWTAGQLPPDWVGGISARYPDNRYIVGIGLGASPSVADDNARAEISKVFISHIHQKSEDVEYHILKTSGNRVTENRTQKIRQATFVLTDKTLSGIRVVEHYVDPNTEPSDYYAVAVLNRIQAEVSLREQIDNMDCQIKHLAASIGITSDALAVIRIIKKAIKISDQREALNAELRVVNATGSGKPAPQISWDLEAELASILKKNFTLGISVSGTHRNEIRKILTEELTQMGFTVNVHSVECRLLIVGKTEILPANIVKSQWQFVRWNANFQLIDRVEDKIIGCINGSGKEGHRTITDADKKALRSLQTMIVSQVSQEISLYIFSQ